VSQRYLAIVVAIVVWAALSYAFIFVFAGGHTCTLAQPVGVNAPATPIPDDVLMARCNRPDVGAIAASIAGLAGIIVVTWGTRPGRSGEP
jgi:hypothetical protein